ncbi:MAG: MFS transporter [Gammaproteobacteria bacterium]|nr:MFS transporter [Gammaproteobacteria bacterium]
MQALATDLYRPSLPHLSDYFGPRVASAQATVWIVVTGFGLAQLLAGPLSDRYGRRPLSIAGGVIYALASALRRRRSVCPSWGAYSKPSAVVRRSWRRVRWCATATRRRRARWF